MLAQAIQAENTKLWALLESRSRAEGPAAAPAAQQTAPAAEVCEQYADMCQRMEADLRERAYVAARLSSAQVPK